MPKYTLDENNSGGRWWLTQEDYVKLFEAGWVYERPEPRPEGPPFHMDYDKPFLSSNKDDTPYGYRKHTSFVADSMKDAVESFEKATGHDFFAEGCNCCGAPFSLSSDTEPHEYLSGDSVERTPIRPF